jgi:hypothetical protein
MSASVKIDVNKVFEVIFVHKRSIYQKLFGWDVGGYHSFSSQNVEFFMLKSL